MAEETEPTTVYTEAGMEGFLEHITNPSERAEKEAFFRGLGRLGAAMNHSYALRERVPKELSTVEPEVVEKIVEGVSEVATRITG